MFQSYSHTISEIERDTIRSAGLTNNEALFLERLRNLMEELKPYRGGKNENDISVFEGRWWIRRTLSELAEEFPFWSEEAVWRTLDTLKSKDLIKEYTPKGLHHDGMWYSINYKNLEAK